jgi:hypothetical protein
MRFFVGLHHPHVAGNFDAAFISVNAIRNRKSAFPANDWIMDSGAFTTIFKHGGYPHTGERVRRPDPALEGQRQPAGGGLQDYMCEKDMLDLHRP